MQSIRDPQGQASREIHAANQAAESASALPTYVSVKRTAELLNVSKLTVYRRYHAGLFPGRKFGRSIDILGAFVWDLVAEIQAGKQVDVEQYAASWHAKVSEGAA